MRVAIVYDCLFPYTVGGAERWYRNLAERLAADGHEVTYLTLRQWARHERTDVPGVGVVAVGPRRRARRGAGPARRRGRVVLPGPAGRRGGGGGGALGGPPPGGRVGGPPGPAPPRPRRAGGGVRRPPHSRETCAGGCPGRGSR